MNNILRAWTSSFVRRWHTQPELCDTNDPISGHQHRCTLLLLLFWPESTRDAIIDCILHDQGESASGDMARPAKNKHPEIRKLLSKVEKDEIVYNQGFCLGSMTDEEIARRKFVDLLDSYLWMLRHKPKMAKKPEWNEQRKLLFTWARELQAPGFHYFMGQAETFFK